VGSLPGMRRPATAAAVALALIGVTGCGEKDEPETTGPLVTADTTATGSTTTSTTEQYSPAAEREKITVLITDFLSSPDAAAVCDTQLTPQFLKAAYGDRQGCLLARKQPTLASSVQVGEIDITSGAGDKATTPATAKGGAYDGQKLTFETVRIGQAWQVSSVESNVKVGP
jgi:hypothetical protein